MTPVMIPDSPSIFYSSSKMIDWMHDNVGAFNVDWKWVSTEQLSRSVLVKDPQKAVLVALRWGAK